jgi:hypothetical protein
VERFAKRTAAEGFVGLPLEEVTREELTREDALEDAVAPAPPEPLAEEAPSTTVPWHAGENARSAAAEMAAERRGAAPLSIQRTRAFTRE